MLNKTTTNYLTKNLKTISYLTSKFFGKFCVQNIYIKNFKNCTSKSRMENITKIWSGPLPADSAYMKPMRCYYIQDETEKNRDIIKAHDSVSIVLFNVTRKKLVFVKQFRPAVFHSIVSSDDNTSLEQVDLKKYPPQLGITLELCAGMIDKKKSWIEIAQEEILEECGYDVDVSRIEEVMSYRTSVGSQGALQKLYYCEVTDTDKKSVGGGVDDEIIEVVEYSVDEVKKLVQKGSNNSPASFFVGIMWFLLNKAPTIGFNSLHPK